MNPMEKLQVIYLIGLAFFTAMFYLAARGNAEMLKKAEWIPYQALVYGLLWPIFIWFALRGAWRSWRKR
jgi:hypothetical protein